MMKIIAIGNEAYAMLGRTSERVSVVQPLCHGVISDYDLIQYTIQSFLKKNYRQQSIYAARCGKCSV